MEEKKKKQAVFDDIDDDFNDEEDNEENIEENNELDINNRMKRNYPKQEGERDSMYDDSENDKDEEKLKNFGSEDEPDEEPEEDYRPAKQEKLVPQKKTNIKIEGPSDDFADEIEIVSPGYSKPAPAPRNEFREERKAEKREAKKEEKQEKKIKKSQKSAKKNALKAAAAKKLVKEEKNRKEKDSEEKEIQHAKEAKSNGKPKKKKKPSKILFWIIGIVIVAVIAFLIFKAATAPGNDDLNKEKMPDWYVDYSGKPVQMELYVMSQCPYGVRAENELIPVLEKLGKGVDLKLHYIATKNPDATYRSLHGQPEVDGDIIQLCAKQHYQYSYLRFIDCQNRNNPGDLKASVQKCADNNSMDAEVIMACFNGPEGKILFDDSIVATEAKGVTASPTIFIDGQKYTGKRDQLSFLKALCAKIPDHVNCQEIPACGSDSDCTEFIDKIGICENPGEETATCIYIEPVKVNIKVLNSKGCTSDACDTSSVISASRTLFKDINVSYVDADSDEGEKLIEDYALVYAPAYIFDSGVETTYVWAKQPTLVESFLKLDDGNFKLRDEATGASQFVNDEARESFLKTLGISFGDNKPQIDFFVMSYCPYGNQAEEAIEKVYKKFGSLAEFRPRYVIYSNYNGGGPNYCIDPASMYCSMHGVQELNQDIREQCVKQSYGLDSWFEFALKMNTACTYKNADTCWQAVADGLDIDKDKVQRCYDENSLAIAGEELRLTNLFGASGSPAIFIEGQQYTGDRTSLAIAQALCDAYEEEKPALCNNLSDLEGSADAAAATAQGQC
ncbi:MAG: hypothetical protein V1659_00405 [Candidatus Woesearchaeota archaeon]